MRSTSSSGVIALLKELTKREMSIDDMIEVTGKSQRNTYGYLDVIKEHFHVEERRNDIPVGTPGARKLFRVSNVYVKE